MNRELPPYASSFADRFGRMHIRFRRTGYPTLYAKAEPGTDEFMDEYLSWKHSAPVKPGQERAAPGTFDDLISRFYSSVMWRSIPKESTKVTYRGELERFRAKFGGRRVSTMTARNVNKLMENMADTPAAANNLLKRLRTLFDYAILLGIRKDNPAKAVRSIRAKGNGFHEWTEDEIAQFKAKHPLGTKARLALEILLCTAQRRSDAATMGEHPKKPGKIAVRQLKTDAFLIIPMHRDLKAAVLACPSEADTFIVSERGTPYSKESFGNWFKKQCVAAGLPHCAAHGLRKAAARRMAELGLSNQLIKSITGHTTESEVARYTKNADQESRAELAMAEMERFGYSGLANSDENGGNA
jgi:integrase